MADTQEGQVKQTMGASASLEGASRELTQGESSREAKSLAKVLGSLDKEVSKRKPMKPSNQANTSETDAPVKPIAESTPKPTKELEVPVYGGMRLAQLESTIDPELRNQINLIQKKQYRQLEVGES